MKLSRLPPNGRSLTQEAAERARAAADATRWHIAPAEGTEPDRHRSAQEELETAPAPALPEDDGKVRKDAQELADEISALGSKAAGLVRSDQSLPRGLAIDTKA